MHFSLGCGVSFIENDLRNWAFVNLSVTYRYFTPMSTLSWNSCGQHTAGCLLQFH